MSMNQLKFIFIFYRPYIIWSIIITIILYSINPSFVFVLVAKLLLSVFLWYFTNETNSKKTMIFYKNVGLSTHNLFASAFLLDVLLSVFIIILTKNLI